MPKVNTFNYDTIASWNGSQDLFVVEQPDGTKVATPAMVKQFIEAGDFEATGEVKDGQGNILSDVAEQLDAASEQISRLTTPTLLWEGSATDVGNIYNLAQNYTNFKYLLLSAKTNVEVKNMLIPTSSISASIIFSDVLSAGAWNATTNSFTYNSCYGIKFTAADVFRLEGLTYNNANWVLRPRAIYGIG